MPQSWEDQRVEAARHYLTAAFRQANLRHRLDQLDKHFVDVSFVTIGNAELNQSDREIKQTSRRWAIASWSTFGGNVGFWTLSSAVAPTPLMQMATYLLMSAGLTTFAWTASATYVGSTIRKELHDRRQAKMLPDDWSAECEALQLELADADYALAKEQDCLLPYLAAWERADLKQTSLDIVRAHEQSLIDASSLKIDALEL